MGKTYECGVSLEKARLLEPGLDVRLVVGGEGLGDGGIGAQLGEDVQAVVDGIAGAGAEGDDGLARKVIGLQEGGNHGGGLLPPDGVAHKDGVIVLHVVHTDGDGGAGFPL